MKPSQLAASFSFWRDSRGLLSWRSLTFFAAFFLPILFRIQVFRRPLGHPFLSLRAASISDYAISQDEAKHSCTCKYYRQRNVRAHIDRQTLRKTFFRE
jgi:hypothetical protein